MPLQPELDYLPVLRRRLRRRLFIRRDKGLRKMELDVADGLFGLTLASHRPSCRNRAFDLDGHHRCVGWVKELGLLKERVLRAHT